MATGEPNPWRCGPHCANGHNQPGAGGNDVYMVYGINAPSGTCNHHPVIDEDGLRKKIAEQIRYELMPLCVCADCGNELEGRLIQQVLDIILNCKKGQ